MALNSLGAERRPNSNVASRGGWKEVIRRSRVGHNELFWSHSLHTKAMHAHAASLCTIMSVRFCYHKYWPARGIAEKSSLQIMKEQHAASPNKKRISTASGPL